MVRQRVESGKAKFLGISAEPGAVENAREKGIPAQNKTAFTFSRFLNFL